MKGNLMQSNSNGMSTMENGCVAELFLKPHQIDNVDKHY